MQVITSKENKIFKKASSLTSKKYRDKLGAYLVEGENLVNEAYLAKKTSAIIVESTYSKELNYDGVPIVFMMSKLFEKLARTETSQGIIAICEKEEYSLDDFEEIIKRKQGNVVVLDRLQDPGNIGTIIRTADAAGYSAVLAVKGTGDIFSPKVVRAASGSVMRVPIYYAKDGFEAIDILNRGNKKIVGTSFDTDKYYYDVDLTNNIGLVIGNEGNGMSDAFLENAHEKIKIPMDEPVESLNAAVAAGILMYQSKKKGV